MAASPKFFDPPTLAKLRGLRLRARHIVEGLVAGLHRSPYRGFSIEFAEHREYAPGDDLRHVDWKLYARSDKVYLKLYEDETNLVCHLAVDASESMAYRGPGAALSKLEYAQCAAAALGWLAVQQQDAASLAIFDAEVRRLLPPGAGAPHYQQLLEALDAAPGPAKTNLGGVLHELSERLPRRGVVLVLSDLFDDPAAVLKGLTRLRRRRHDVIVLHVLDGAELDFPFRQTTLFRGLEQGPEVSVDAPALRQAYRAEIGRYLQTMKSGCHAAGIDYQLLRTDQPLDVSLAAYLAGRSLRVK